MTTAKDIRPDGTVICCNCKTPHALFYVRSSDTKRELRWLCTKAQRKWTDKQGYVHLKRCRRQYPVEFVDDLDIEERWTKKYAKAVQDRKQLETA